MVGQILPQQSQSGEIVDFEEQEMLIGNIEARENISLNLLERLRH